jgi:exosortase/archaeosortase family protein
MHVPPELLAKRPALLLAVHAAAFWPVWRWYLDRMNDGADEPWAVIALAAALFVSWPSRSLRIDGADHLLSLAALLTLVYAASAPFAPPLVRALLAMAALACSWTSIAGARERLPAVLALLALSLPVLASLQFYAGFPLRVATTSGATGLLNVAGFDVVRVGTSMARDGHMVLVDAPCSGVRMWWTACVLCCVLAAQRLRLTFRGMAFSLLLALPIVLAANSARAAMLFLLETAASPPSPLAHSLVGIATFTLVAVLLLASERLQNLWRPRLPLEPAMVRA